jgi:glutamate--cysteine ligase
VPHNPIEMPKLVAAGCKPLNSLENTILTQQAKVELWFREQFHKTPPPITASVDLRNSGYKIAPVDTNLFPAGFNNLNPGLLPLAIQAVQASLQVVKPNCRRILLIPETHSRNVFYYQSLRILYRVLQKAGYEVRIGSLIPGLREAQSVIAVENEPPLVIEPIERRDNTLWIGDFRPCVILLNNDLSDGIPDILKNLEQMVMPALELGWSTRWKSQHFHYYQQAATELASELTIDPWLISPEFDVCQNLDFVERRGEEDLAASVARILSKTQEKYNQYEITQTPFVAVKADAGTYGMGIMMVHSADEIITLNRKQRNTMSSSKGGRKITQVIVQEGVYTNEFLGKENTVAEPVIYMVGPYVVGGFYRLHEKRGIQENLNSPGMHFQPLAFADPCNNPDSQLPLDVGVNRFYIYGVIARLALVAAAREMAGALAK